MIEIDRRSMMLLGVAAGAASLLPNSSLAQNKVGSAANPVTFWNDVSLEMVALDHTVAVADARAPGPCATARALGLIHAVIADAVTFAYPTAGYAPKFGSNPGANVKDSAAFVGGAAAGIMGFIYNTPAHAFVIGVRQREFMAGLSGEYDQWKIGLMFGTADDIQERWKAEEIRRRLLNSRAYQPDPGQHTLDPFNPDQGFYGARWGGMAPLILPNDDAEKDKLGPGAPPGWNAATGEITIPMDQFDDVKMRGQFNGTGATDDQQVGLYWAYDGARLLGTPPRLYNLIVRNIADQAQLGIPELARLLALCNLAMADAGIVAWKAKYDYKVQRPVVAIRAVDKTWRPLGAPRTNPKEFSAVFSTKFIATAESLLGAGLSELLLQAPGLSASQARQSTFRSPLFDHQKQSEPVIESEADRVPSGLPYADAAFTPNFPAYPSGHATFGSACFNVLKARLKALGQDDDAVSMNFVSEEVSEGTIDNFRNEPRTPWSKGAYSSIDKMIEDNNESRVWLGVHWQFDATKGDESGKKIAQTVLAGAYS
ncbi:MAG: hypothetical protein E5X41_30560 [Mesorhizobium sp.]|nr:MAG: hypothetical protein E5X41_30560 [Mesorhizobium sp.]